MNTRNVLFLCACLLLVLAPVLGQETPRRRPNADRVPRRMPNPDRMPRRMPNPDRMPRRMPNPDRVPGRVAMKTTMPKQVPPTAVAPEVAPKMEAKPTAVAPEVAPKMEAKPKAVAPEVAPKMEAKPKAVAPEVAPKMEAKPTAVAPEVAPKMEAKPTAVAPEVAPKMAKKPKTEGARKKDKMTGCKGVVTYKVVNDCKWSAAAHPTDYPEKAHFSPLCGTVHNDGFMMWRVNAQATNGVKNIAELGDCTQMSNEVLHCMGQGNCREPLSFDCSEFSGTCKHEGTFTVTEKMHTASFLSMIAPSPDWGVGVDSVDFCDAGKWVKSYEMDLHAVDVGTDGGTTFMSEDVPLGLFRPMTILDNADESNIFYNEKKGKLFPICKITFELQ